MKNIMKRFGVAMLMITMLLAMTGTAFAAKKAKVPAAVDYDTVEVLEKDFSQAAQLPLTGWFEKSFEDGRTCKVYVSPEASVRSYFTIVAVPDGQDTYKFLQKEGWFDVADAKGEGLMVLEPGEKGWGKAADEAAYMEEAIGFFRSGVNANGVTVFSVFGEYYLAGYGKGGAALEMWAAKNPILVISQVYVNGKSAGNKALDAVSSTPYDGVSSNGDITPILGETLAEVGIAGEAAPKDLAVPTFLVNFKGSEKHWMTANNTYKIPDLAGVYHQKIKAKNYSTDYANGVRKANGEKYGISEVKIALAKGKLNAAKIYAYMAKWTRYDTTFPYSNALADRLDYTAARVAAQQMAKDGVVKAVMDDGTEVYGTADVKVKGHGTVQVGVIAFADNNGDGKNDPREYLAYIPNSIKKSSKKAPIMMVYPGNSQTDSIFMDSTLWWQLADKEGIALVFICETYSANACSVSHANSDQFQLTMINILQDCFDGKYANLDFTRVYGSGQSAGSAATQGFAATNPEFFAAVASTSAATSGANGVNKMIPTMLITGQMDMGNMGQGMDSPTVIAWGNYFLKANGIQKAFTVEDASSCVAADPRHPAIYSFNNAQDIPMVRYGLCILRPHNCYPSDMPLLWDFAKHYAKDENGVRYYSASAFEKDDAVMITRSGLDMDDVESIQAITDETPYGTGVVRVEVNYKEGADLSALTPDSYILEDRGSLAPVFGKIDIASVEVQGQKAILNVKLDSDATAVNNIIYTGENAGVRQRDAYGVYVTGAYYRDVNGVIHYGKEDTDAWVKNETGQGYQVRETLELKLRHDGEPAAAAECLADELGKVNTESKWLETIDLQFGEDGFLDLHDLQIPSTSAAATDGSGDPYVRGFYHVPANYDPANGIVVYLQSQGISYWQLPDGTNNAGCGFYFCSNTYSWIDNVDAIVINIQDRSSSAAAYGEYDDVYDYVVDDVNVMKYFIEKYNIPVDAPHVIQGNSRGTMASNTVIMALAGCEYNINGDAKRGTAKLDKEVYPFHITTYICQNGTMGGNYWANNGDLDTIAGLGMRVWAFDGEQDTNNVDTIADYIAALKRAGFENAWIEENVRLTGYNSEIYAYWGESDHSTTRMQGLYFADQAYYGPSATVDPATGALVYETKLQDGDTYTLPCRGKAAGTSKDGYEYKIYDELFQVWAVK